MRNVKYFYRNCNISFILYINKIQSIGRKKRIDDPSTPAMPPELLLFYDFMRAMMVLNSRSKW